MAEQQTHDGPMGGGPRGGRMMPGEKAKDFKGTMGKLHVHTWANICPPSSR